MEFLLDWLAGSFEIKTNGRDKAEEIIADLEAVCPDLYRESWFDSPKKIMTYDTMLSWYNKGILYLAWREHDNKNRLHLCFTSQAIQQLGRDNIIAIYDVLKQKNFRASRIDIALDVFNKSDIHLDKMLQSFKLFSHYGEKTVVSKILRKNFKIACAQFYDGEPRENWTIGGRTGHVFFRFYDKKLEQKLSRQKVTEMIQKGDIKPEEREYFKKRSIYWYRVEIELKQSHAVEAFKHLQDFDALPGIFTAVLEKHIRFVEPKYDDHNAGKNPTCDWYEETIQLLKSYYFVQFNPEQNKIKDLMKTMGWYRSLRKSKAVMEAILQGTLDKFRTDELEDFLDAIQEGRYQWMLKVSGLSVGADFATGKVYIYSSCTPEMVTSCA